MAELKSTSLNDSMLSSFNILDSDFYSKITLFFVFFIQEQIQHHAIPQEKNLRNISPIVHE